MSNFRDFLKEQLQDPKVKKEYEALAAEYAIKQAMIDAQNMSQGELSQRTRLTQSDISKPEHGKPNKQEAFQSPLNLLPEEGVELDLAEADRSKLKERSPRQEFSAQQLKMPYMKFKPRTLKEILDFHT